MFNSGSVSQRGPVVTIAPWGTRLTGVGGKKGLPDGGRAHPSGLPVPTSARMGGSVGGGGAACMPMAYVGNGAEKVPGGPLQAGCMGASGGGWNVNGGDAAGDPRGGGYSIVRGRPAGIEGPYTGAWPYPLWKDATPRLAPAAPK